MTDKDKATDNAPKERKKITTLEEMRDSLEKKCNVKKVDPPKNWAKAIFPKNPPGYLERCREHMKKQKVKSSK